MKAIVFDRVGGPEVLTLTDLPKPQVRSGGVLINASGASFGNSSTGMSPQTCSAT